MPGFESLVAEMSSAIFDQLGDGDATTNTATPPGGGAAVAVEGMINEPSESPFEHTKPAGLRERRIMLTLHLPAAAAVARGWTVTIGARSFEVDSVKARDQNYLDLNARETT